jgi:tyrosyl-tRNA synthetase
MKNLVEELQWRGLVHDIMPGTEEQLLKEMTTTYIGFDPTSDSLHIGSLVPIILLVHLEKFGHKPIALVGGATGMIGDPSGKSDERNLLDEVALEKKTLGLVQPRHARVRGFASTNTIGSTDSYTVQNSENWVVAGTFTVNGQLTVNGAMHFL